MAKIDEKEMEIPKTTDRKIIALMQVGGLQSVRSQHNRTIHFSEGTSCYTIQNTWLQKTSATFLLPHTHKEFDSGDWSRWQRNGLSRWDKLWFNWIKPPEAQTTVRCTHGLYWEDERLLASKVFDRTPVNVGNGTRTRNGCFISINTFIKYLPFLKMSFCLKFWKRLLFLSFSI